MMGNFNLMKLFPEGLDMILSTLLIFSGIRVAQCSFLCSVFPEDLDMIVSSLPIFSGIRVAQCSFLCRVFSEGLDMILSSLLNFSGIRVAQCSFLCRVFVYLCLSFCPFLLSIAFSVLRFTASDYSFGLFKFFLADIFNRPFVFLVPPNFQIIWLSNLLTMNRRYEVILVILFSHFGFIASKTLNYLGFPIFRC